MAELIKHLTRMAPDSRLYRLASGEAVIVTVPEVGEPGDLHTPFGVVRLAAVPPQTTQVFACDEIGRPVDADGDPTNGLTALHEFPPGTSHEMALAALERGDD